MHSKNAVSRFVRQIAIQPRTAGKHPALENQRREMSSEDSTAEYDQRRTRMRIPLDDDEFAVDGIEADRKLLSAQKNTPGSSLPGVSIL